MRVAALALLIAACSSKPAPPATGTASGSAPIAAPTVDAAAPVVVEPDAAAGDVGDVPFEKLDHDGKVAVMKKQVMPAMRKAFAGFDPEEYAKVTCKTCHGKDPDAVKFKMPSPDLPKLDFKELEAGKHQKEADFMSKIVKPEMAKILGEVEMTNDNPNGFGCLNCHEEKK